MTFVISQQQRFIVTFTLPARSANLKKTETATYYFDTQNQAEEFAELFVEMNNNNV
jgi:hypothetical protein